jgi:hypothetical protein
LATLEGDDDDDEEDFLDLDHVGGSSQAEPSDEDSDDNSLSSQKEVLLKKLPTNPISRSIPAESRMAIRSSPVIETKTEVKKASPIVEVKKVSPEVKKPPLVPEKKARTPVKKEPKEPKERKKKKESPVPEVELPPKKKRVEITPLEAEKEGRDLKHEADAISRSDPRKSTQLYILSCCRYLFAALKKEKSSDVKLFLHSTIQLLSFTIVNSKAYPEEHGLAYLLRGFCSMKLATMIKYELRSLSENCHNSVAETKKYVEDSKIFYHVFDSLEKSQKYYKDSPFHTNFYNCSLEEFLDYVDDKYNKLNS